MIIFILMPWRPRASLLFSYGKKPGMHGLAPAVTPPGSIPAE